MLQKVLEYTGFSMTEMGRHPAFDYIFFPSRGIDQNVWTARTFGINFNRVNLSCEDLFSSFSVTRLKNEKVKKTENFSTGWPPIFVIENPVYSSTFWSNFADFQAKIDGC